MHICIIIVYILDLSTFLEKAKSRYKLVREFKM